MVLRCSEATVASTKWHSNEGSVSRAKTMGLAVMVFDVENEEQWALNTMQYYAKHNKIQ